MVYPWCNLRTKSISSAACCCAAEVLVTPFHQLIGNGLVSEGHAHYQFLTAPEFLGSAKVADSPTELLVPPAYPNAIEAARLGAFAATVRSDQAEHPCVGALTWDQFLAALDTCADGDRS